VLIFNTKIVSYPNSQFLKILYNSPISAEEYYQLRNFFSSIGETMDAFEIFINDSNIAITFEKNYAKDSLMQALNEQIAKEALEAEFILALFAVAQAIENSTYPLVNNSLTLKLVETFKEANEARSKIQIAPNLAKAQKEAEDKARSGLFNFFVQARPKSFNIIDFFAEILTRTGFNRIQTYSSVRELFDNAEFNIIRNRGLIGQEGL
jgi:hypothetical protein